MPKTILCAALLGALFVMPTTAHAHDGAMGVIKERMDHMKVLGKSMKALAPFIQGKVAFDQVEIARLAKEIDAHSGETLTKLFPKDSLGAPSEARAEIWQKWSRFEALAQELKDQAQTLLKSSSGQPWLRAPMASQTSTSTLGGGQNVMADGPAGMPAEMVIRMNFMHLSSACKSCHTDFRQKKKEN